jgi:hypothetical protein
MVFLHPLPLCATNSRYSVPTLHIYFHTLPTITLSTLYLLRTFTFTLCPQTENSLAVRPPAAPQGAVIEYMPLMDTYTYIPVHFLSRQSLHNQLGLDLSFGHQSLEQALVQPNNSSPQSCMCVCVPVLPSNTYTLNCCTCVHACVQVAFGMKKKNSDCCVSSFPISTTVSC